MLQQAKNSPDINNYLAYLFSSAQAPDGLSYNEQEFHLVRSAAGIMLKNHVRTEWKSIPESSLQLIKYAVPMCLQDKNSQIRNFAGNIATEVINRSGLLGWPELLPQLLESIGNASGQVSNEAQEGAMSAMAKICEDNYRLLAKEVNGQRPLNYILPELIRATKNELPKVRVGALVALNVFTARHSQAMLNSVDDLLQHLFILSSDQNADVRRQVCRAFVHLVETRADKLQPHLSGLVDYILTQQSSDDEDLACEAAEFWLAVGEHDDLWRSLQPYLQKIIPVLLKCMVYSGEDIAILGGASDDEDEEDRQEDIKPAFAQSKKRGAAAAAAANGEVQSGEQDASAYQKLSEMDDDVEEGEIEGFDDGDDANPDEKWTLRKCSAAALDVFARDFRGPVFEAIFPYLSQNLKHDDWPHREAAVLALGAVAEGCMNVVVPHLPELVPYLISLLEDSEPVVRQITCWTLGRYSAWAANLTDPAQKEQFFVPMMDGILRKMLDKNKKVQEAAVSAFANLEEKAGKHLEPYCGPIIQQFVLCFRKYKDRNMYVLYDCVQTLAERLGSFLALPELSNQLMPALIERYNQVPDQSRELFPLLECLSYVAVALGDAFAPYSPTIFTRCVNIIHMNLEQTLAATGNPVVDLPDKDFLITSLDLLSSIIQALDGPKSAELVQTSQQPFFELLSFCMQDPEDGVRQSAYALLGDSARFVFQHLEPYLPTLVPLLLKQIDLDSILDDDVDGTFGVVNNACWSTGEIAMQLGKKMSPWVPELTSRFVEMLSNPRVPKGLQENAAIALGRLGIHNAELLAPNLPSFADEFLNAMTDVDPSEEKSTAFKGFTAIVAQNPQSIESVLLDFFTAIAQYEDMDLHSPEKRELHEAFQNVGFPKLTMPSWFPVSTWPSFKYTDTSLFRSLTSTNK
jgi:HEAT repeat protein